MKQGQKAAQVPQRAQILAVDYGRARMGLAIADAEVRLARPLATLERVNRNEDMRRLRELVREHGVKQIVVGLPLRLDGTRGEMAEEAERFAARVTKQIGVRVELVDERLTSWEAERLMEEEFGRVGRLRGRNTSRPGQNPHTQKRRVGHPIDTGKTHLQGPRVGHAKEKKEAGSGVSVDAVAAAVILKDYLGRQGLGNQQAKSSEG